MKALRAIVFFFATLLTYLGAPLLGWGLGYLGVIALSIGVSCIFRSWIGLIASAIFLIILLYRIKDEETLMQKEFGGEWEAYCKRSWRLIPYIF